MGRAVVVGSGPNGLAAANVLVDGGWDVTVLEAHDALGGGARSTLGELHPGLVVDHCAAVHPLAAVSPALHSLALDVRWRTGPIECAHPLDGGDAALLYRSVSRTAAELGDHGRRWRRLFEPSAREFSGLAQDLLAPPLHLPQRPLPFVRFGALAAPPPAVMTRVLGSGRAAALYAGVAAHAFQPFARPLVGAIGAALITAAHGVGWPVVEGGTGALTDAVVQALRAKGVAFETGHRVRSEADLPPHDIAVLDLHPHAIARILAGRLPAHRRRRLERFRSGPAAFKVDFAVDGGVPWAHPSVGRAPTVHLGGEAREIAATERAIARGTMPARPFVLVSQQAVADPGRGSGSVVPISAYAHVPHAYDQDATDAITRQIERFAPGFRERIVAQRSVSVTDFERENANVVGGDILTGAKTALQFLGGSAPLTRPYSTGVPGYYMCSAATPPGPGVHGMSGFHAAHRVRRDTVR